MPARVGEGRRMRAKVGGGEQRLSEACEGLRRLAGVRGGWRRRAQVGRGLRRLAGVRETRWARAKVGEGLRRPTEVGEGRWRRAKGGGGERRAVECGRRSAEAGEGCPSLSPCAQALIAPFVLALAPHCRALLPALPPRVAFTGPLSLSLSCPTLERFGPFAAPFPPLLGASCVYGLSLPASDRFVLVPPPLAPRSSVSHLVWMSGNSTPDPPHIAPEKTPDRPRIGPNGAVHRQKSQVAGPGAWTPWALATLAAAIPVPYLQRRQCSTSAVGVQYQCSTHAAPAPYHCGASAAPVSYLYSTSGVPEQRQCGARIRPNPGPVHLFLKRNSGRSSLEMGPNPVEFGFGYMPK